ncbi:hypothetical protein DPV78_002533 [Talaromyces pinophilus]|nr:hypothetical protein DPV78_002533 [Talaromyces pinophilus]
MTVEGQCNCGSIRVAFDEVPDGCILCYCDNCRRSGGLSSVNFFLDESNIAVHDPNNVLRKYTDKNTASGGVIERQFCGTCGSPILSLVLADPGTVFVKASLLNVEDIPQPKKENFPHKKPQWMGEINHL